jgi:hypothetical protein
MAHLRVSGLIEKYSNKMLGAALFGGALFGTLLTATWFFYKLTRNPHDAFESLSLIWLSSSILGFLLRLVFLMRSEGKKRATK